ncbi:JmjC domain-containing protein, partial [Streptomyces cinereoruber]|uniref:JmjC domain-containing protein n=1 Tax=Streptomyces cinereoruber TaxID=67260 RepID=UPI003644107C
GTDFTCGPHLNKDGIGQLEKCTQLVIAVIVLSGSDSALSSQVKGRAERGPGQLATSSISPDTSATALSLSIYGTPALDYIKRWKVRNMEFSDFLAPLSEEQFLSDFLGKEPCITKGVPGRFEDLLPWGSINDTLRHHRFRDHSQITLAKNHQAVPLEKFNPEIPTFPLPGAKALHRRVESSVLTECLRDGATLQIKSMEMISEPIARFAAMLARKIRERVSVDAFICFGEAPGFHPHWDRTDAIAIQVHGRKKWRITEPDVKYPMPEGGAVSKTGQPAGETKEVVLASGDILYMPRGWWHEVTPMQGWSVHLTATFHRSTGMDWAHWILQQLQAEEIFRQDLPQQWESPNLLREHIGNLSEHFRNILDKHQELRKFFTEKQGEQPFLQPFNLPFISTIDGLPDKEDFVIRWQAPLAAIERCDRKILIHAGGGKYTFDSILLPLFDSLTSSGSLTMEEAFRLLPQDTSHGSVRDVISELAFSGLVNIEAAY